MKHKGTISADLCLPKNSLSCFKKRTIGLDV